MKQFTSITELLRQGMLNDVVEHAKQELQKVGTLRGGSCGAIIKDKVYGNCPRMAALRFIGIQTPADEQSQLLMAFGVANEDVVTRFLLAANLPPSKIRREEAVPVTYTHRSGKTVTGRPDGVIFSLLDDEGKPFHGLEFKLKGTYYGAKNILMEGKVDTKHIIQSFHYMIKLGMKKYSIVYSIPVRFAVQDRDAAKLKAAGVTENRESDGHPQYLKLGLYVSTLEIGADGTLSILNETTGKRTKLPLKDEHIQDFYQQVVDMAERRKMATMPSGSSVIPRQKEWKDCDYCPLKHLCKNYEGSIDEWFDRAVEIVSEEWRTTYPELYHLYLNDFES